MKNLILTLLLLCSFAQTATAHDEGHGPQVSDTGKFGGLMAPVIKKSDENLGAKARLIYKSELARSGDGTVRVYIYDEAMKPMNLKHFDSKATGLLVAKVKGKWVDTAFPLELKDGVFIGKMPKPQSKPYNIEVTIKNAGTELLSAYENLD